MLFTIQDRELRETLEAKVDAVVSVGKDKWGLDPESPNRNIARSCKLLKTAAERYLYERQVHENLPTRTELIGLLDAVILNAPPIIEAMKKLPILFVPTLEDMAELEAPKCFFGIPDDTRKRIEEIIGELEDFDNAPSLEEVLDEMGLSPMEKMQALKEYELETERYIYRNYSLSDTMDNLQRLEQAAKKLASEYGRKSTKQMYWRNFIWFVPKVMQGAPKEYKDTISENQFISACLNELDPDLSKDQIKFMLGQARKEREELAG